MATMDVFKADAFSMMELSSTVEEMDFNPQMLGSMNLFTPKPVRQKTVMIDRKDDTLSLIGFSERGSAPDQNERYDRNALSLTIPRLAIQDTVWASEVSGLREFGTESELMSVQREVAGRL
ncbi:MAG: major capsid protein, partial [Gammaproteobacteria bacterium]|nr:major capsid protein [Gammaproteobacteria bacterium]